MSVSDLLLSFHESSPYDDASQNLVVPNARLYRHPRGAASLWIYNADARAYVQPGQEIDRDHDGPSDTVSER